jgi:hypothetical protein
MVIKVTVVGQIAPPDADPEAPLDPELPEAIRDTEFSATVLASPEEGDEDGPPLDPIVIESVAAVLLGDPDNGIKITPGTDSVTISGKHTSTFNDIFTFVSKGQSDKTETPKIVAGRNLLPDDANLFDLDQDRAGEKIREFKVIVTYHIPPAINTKLTEEVTIPQTVENGLEGVRQFMANYNYNGSKG